MAGLRLSVNSRGAADSAEFFFPLLPPSAAYALSMNSRTTDSRSAADSAEFFFPLLPSRAACALIALLVLGCLSAAGATITGGFLNWRLDALEPFNLTSRDFAVNGTVDGLVSPGFFPAADCLPESCAPGQEVSLRGSLTSTRDNSGSGIVNGVAYPTRTLEFLINFTFRSELITLARDVDSYTAPFILTGTFGITTPPGDDFVIIWPLGGGVAAISGAGTATARFNITDRPDGSQLFGFRDITYRFEEIPEPGTAGLLLGAAVLWFLGRRRRRC